MNGARQFSIFGFLKIAGHLITYLIMFGSSRTWCKRIVFYTCYLTMNSIFTSPIVVSISTLFGYLFSFLQTPILPPNKNKNNETDFKNFSCSRINYKPVYNSLQQEQSSRSSTRQHFKCRDTYLERNSI